MIEKEKITNEQMKTHKKHYGVSFAEETTREKARGLDDSELKWTIDELIKLGRIRGAMII